jgi:hypothetical protein
MTEKQTDSNLEATALRSFQFKRAIIGGISLACLLMAGLLYAASPDLNNILLATTARIGVVLFAIWLALPQLRGIMSKLPAVLPIVALALVILCAARPNLFRIVGSLIVITTALLGISNWIKRFTT